LADSNPWNLSTTVEINILKPLIEYGYIDSYEKEGENPKAPKYIIHRFGSKKNG
jgi:ribosomal protein S8